MLAQQPVHFQCAFPKFKGSQPFKRLPVISCTFPTWLFVPQAPLGGSHCDKCQPGCCWFVSFGCSSSGWVSLSYQRCPNTLSHLPGSWNPQLQTKSPVSAAQSTEKNPICSPGGMKGNSSQIEMSRGSLPAANFSHGNTTEVLGLEAGLG